MKRLFLLSAAILAVCCSTLPPGGTPPGETPADDKTPSGPLPKALVVGAKIDGKGVRDKEIADKVSLTPSIALEFSRDIKADEASLSSVDFSGGSLSVAVDPANSTVLVFRPVDQLSSGTRYRFTISAGECFGVNLQKEFTFWLTTAVEFDDKTDKFPQIPDEDLLTLVQERTFKYFWDYAHPVSGLARERLGSGDTVTSGGSGFGIMAIPVGIERGFITRDEGAERMRKIIGFLSSAQTFHGAYPHWLNGSTGKVIPFSEKDNGGDLVETAFLMEGLLTAQAYFDRDSEADIRSGIDAIWRGVEWDWYTQGGQKVLYWHWSPDKGWAMNMQIRGWNEPMYTVRDGVHSHSPWREISPFSLPIIPSLAWIPAICPTQTAATGSRMWPRHVTITITAYVILSGMPVIRPVHGALPPAIILGGI